MRPVQFPRNQKSDYPNAASLPRNPQSPEGAPQQSSPKTGTQEAKNSEQAKPKQPSPKDKAQQAAPEQMPGSAQPD